MNVYYTATIDGTELQLIRTRISKEMFAPGDFEMIVKNDYGLSPQTNYDTCIGAAGISGQGKDVIISRKGTETFKGVVDNVKISNKMIRITGRGEAIKLAWDSCTEWQEYIATQANTVISNLLSGTLITLGSSDFTANINVGYQEGENKFRALYGLVKNYLNGEPYVSAGKFYAKTAMGTDKSATVTLEHGKNIISLSREIDSFDLANWVKSRGVGEGTFQLTSGPLQDAASQTAYNVRKLVYDAKRVYNQSELDSITTKLLADNKDPTDTLEKVLFLDTGDFGLGIGDTVTVINSRLGVSGSYRIFEMKYSWDTKGELITATLSNNSRSIEKEIADISYRLDIEKFYPQGSPLWIPIQLPFTPLDVNEDIRHEFVIPDTSDWDVNINDGEISVFSDRYRVWSKGAADGGSSNAGGSGASASAGDSFGPLNINTWTDVKTLPDANITADTSKITLVVNGYIEGFANPNAKTLLHFRIKDGTGNYHPAGASTSIRTVLPQKTINYAIKHKHKVFDYLAGNVGTPSIWDKYNIQIIDDSEHYLYLPETWQSDLYSYNSTSMDNANTKQSETDAMAAMYLPFSVALEAYGQFNGKGDLTLQMKTDTNYAVADTNGEIYVTWWAQGEHSHDPEPGIYEFTGEWPVDVEVWVNGVKVADKTTHAGLAGGGKFTVRNINVLSQLQTGANIITLKSTGAGSKGTLSMSGGSRVFVRSK